MIRRLAFGLALLAVAGLMAFAIVVRSTQITPEQAHLRNYPSAIGHKEARNGHIWSMRQTGDGTAQMQRWDAIIRATPRTTYLAGSIEQGMITYVTRSALWRFPDTTTVQRNVALIEGGAPAFFVEGRSYFGMLDYGVNERRIRGWLADLGIEG